MKIVPFMDSNKRVSFAGVTRGTRVLISVIMQISTSIQSKMYICKQQPETLLQKILKILYGLDTTEVDDTDVIWGVPLCCGFAWFRGGCLSGLVWGFVLFFFF